VFLSLMMRAELMQPGLQIFADPHMFNVKLTLSRARQSLHSTHASDYPRRAPGPCRDHPSGASSRFGASQVLTRVPRRPGAPARHQPAPGRRPEF
jgi:hypothetical protein